MPQAGAPIGPHLPAVWPAKGQRLRHDLQQVAVHRRAGFCHKADDATHRPATFACRVVYCAPDPFPPTIATPPHSSQA